MAWDEKLQKMTGCVQGVIEAQSSLHVPLDVIAQELEEQETAAHFIIVGSRGFSLVCFLLIHTQWAGLDLNDFDTYNTKYNQ